MYNARHAPDLRAYLNKRLRHSSVSAELPEPSRRLAREIASGATARGPGPARRSAARRAPHAYYPQARFIEDATYARELDSRLR